MRVILPTLCLLTPALLHAQDPGSKPARKFTSFSLLPPGSELNDVMLPRYDDQQRLVGVLKARAMTLINEESISGKSVSIGFFNPDGSARGRVDLAKAFFRQSAGTLEALEKVEIQSDRIQATGHGLIYHFEQGEGFLTGPVQTRIQAPSETTMNTNPSRSIAVGMAAMTLLPQTTSAAQPPPVTAAEKRAIEADAAPKGQEHAASVVEIRKELKADLDASAAATAAVQAFIEKHGNLSGSDDPAGASPTPGEAKSLDLKAGPGATLIECDGGMYFDPDEGLFVFLRNVRVNDPRFTLTGANELKIFLEKKPSKDESKTKPANDPKETEKNKDPEKTGKEPAGKQFGDVDRVVATGNIYMVQKKTAEVKEPAEASGAVFSYQVKTGQATLSGGKLWGKRGQIALRAREPNLTLRIQKSGHLITEGNWETIIVTEKKP